MLNARINQKGISLVELMVGIAIALILLAGVLTVMLRITTAGGESIKSTRLNQQLRSSMDFVVKELQRSGYLNWQATWDSAGGADMSDFYKDVLPVLSDIGEVTLEKLANSAGTSVSGSCPPQDDCDCVLFSYDLDENGAQSTGDFELFAIRRTEDANGRGRLQTRTSGTHDCTSSAGWAEITDDNVNITAFTMNLDYSTTADGDSTIYQLDKTNDWEWPGSTFNSGIGSGAGECNPSAGSDPDVLDDGDVICLERRSILINLEGELTDEPGVRVRLESRVKLKNDYWNMGL